MTANRFRSAASAGSARTYMAPIELMERLEMIAADVAAEAAPNNEGARVARNEAGTERARSAAFRELCAYLRSGGDGAAVELAEALWRRPATIVAPEGAPSIEGAREARDDPAPLDPAFLKGL